MRFVILVHDPDFRLAGVLDLVTHHIIDVATDSLIVEGAGDQDKVDSLHELLKDFGVVEVMRTGTIALNRGLETKEQDSNKTGRQNWGESASV